MWRNCEAAGECNRVKPDEVNLPRLLKVNLQEKTLTNTKAGNRTTPIDTVQRADGRVILHGVQGGRGWSAVLVEDTGDLSATVAEDGGAFVIFGACTTP